MLRLLPKSFIFGLLALALPIAALASAVVQSTQGDVRANGTPVSLNQRLNPGTVLTTGPNAQVVMRFDDDQRVVLNQNTEFRIVDFRYNASNPREDRSIFDLVRGALRIVTGAVASRNQAAFQLRAPQATIGVRGTDFMVSIVNPLYVSVLSGSIGLTNAAGTVVIGAGSFGVVSTAGTLGAAIPASAVPGAASGAFGTMGAVPGVGAGAAGATGVAGGTAAGAGTTVGTATAGSLGVAAGIAVGATAAAAVSTSDSNATPVPTTTHHP
jgi:hypothetical protein